MAPITATAVRVGRRELSLSNLQKVLYPADHFTKAQVIDYYSRIADIILAHLKGRPLTLKRYPGGVEQAFFYEKRCPSHRPQWMKTIHVWSDDKRANVSYCQVDSPAALVWVANLAALELHTLLAREDDLDRPTAMVFDLDPGAPATIVDCIPVALRLRDLLSKAGLESLVKTSGGKGLHVWVPLNSDATFEQTKHFAHAVAELLQRHDPEHVTANMRKSVRGGRVFIDWSQNDTHKTTVCAYSLRAREHPTVSTPVTWRELQTAENTGNAESLTFLAAQVLRRVKQKGDLFAPVLALKQKLEGRGDHLRS